MASQNAILDSNTFAIGINTRFTDSYMKALEANSALLAAFMELNVPARSRSERFGYPESSPYPERWDRGDSVSEGVFKTRTYTASVLRWAKSLGWWADDRRDDQLGAINRAAEEFGSNFGTLPERVLIQLLTSSTDSRLLSSIPNAPDGAALFSATDGAGADRFGVSGGNIQTGSGVATSDAIRNDTFDAVERIGSFKDTESQPLQSTPRRVTLVYGIANEKRFLEAFRQERTVEGSATPTNVIMVSGISFRLWSSPRITDNDYFLVADDLGPRPLFQLTRQALTSTRFDRNNDPDARREGREGLMYEAHYGFGVNLPRNVVKINN